MKKTAIIFGGTGFIGLHFTDFLLRNTDIESVVLADIKPPEEHAASEFIQPHVNAGKVSYVFSDVRRKIEDGIAEGRHIAFIANFAAVHREPGHESHEYYETNIPGAENVTSFAERINCPDLIFTSSISPYGPTEAPKDETTIPTPETAYGGSKLAGELIHKAWQAADRNARRLLIVRPGVVFGPGEGGNVSRLVKMLSKGFFVYAGNQDTRKAGIYVRELCHAIWWLRENAGQAGLGVQLANLTMNPGPSMQEYVEAIKQTSGKKAWVPSIPAWLLLLAARIIGTGCDLLGIKTSVNVVRVRKLVRSNNIIPGTLNALNYKYIYSLKSAFADWKTAMPAEWGIEKPHRKE